MLVILLLAFANLLVFTAIINIRMIGMSFPIIRVLQRQFFAVRDQQVAALFSSAFW